MLFIVVIAILSAFFTFILMPKLIKGLTERGVLVRDYYKIRETYIPDKGGIAIMFACGLMICLFPMLAYLTRNFTRILDLHELIPILENEPYVIAINDSIIMTLLVFGVLGLMDDYIDVGRPLKVLLPIFFTVPMILAVDPDFMTTPLAGGTVDLQTSVIGIITLSVIYRFLVVPVYIIVTSNLVNMHSGFNGLATGTSLIILITLIVKSQAQSFTSDIIAIGAITGALFALWWYNKYPSKIIEGNNGALMIGAAIGITIIVKGLLIAGFIMLLPHTINFLLYVYWRIQHMRKPDDERFKAKKFGKIRKDGTIEVPNRLTLKWILPYYFRMTEKQTVLAMYLLTLIFCLLGFLVPSEQVWAI